MRTLGFKRNGNASKESLKTETYTTFNPQRPEQALTVVQVLDLVSRILKWLPESLN